MVGNRLRPFTAIEKVTDGLSATVTIDYAPITDPVVYTHTPIYNNYPFVSVPDSKSYRVLSKNESNGIGGFNTKIYNYENQVYHMDGGGSLGFSKMTTTEHDGTSQVNTYSQDFDSRTHGHLIESSRYSSSGQLVSTTSHTLDCDQKAGIGQPFAAELMCYVRQPVTEVTKFDLGIALSVTLASWTFDEYRNVLSITESATDAYGSSNMAV